MAEPKTQELNLDAKPQPSGGKKRLILIILGAIVLIGASVGGTLFFLGGNTKSVDAGPPPPPKPIYQPLKSMVINFGAKGPARFMQVDIEMMAFDNAPLMAIEEHMPVIRNNILLLLSSRTFDEVASREGKEALRADILGSINSTLAELADLKEGAGIQAVYFTGFVMQ